MGTKERKWMKGVGGVTSLLYRMALIHLCELDTLKLFSGSRFEGSNRHRLVGRRPGETDLLHIRKAKPPMRLRLERVEECAGERVRANDWAGAGGV